MICPLAPAHLAGLAAFQLFALLLCFNPVLATVPLILFVLSCLLAPLLSGFSYFLPITTHGRRQGQAVAVTIDDGPDPDFTPQVLEVLASHGVPATFFLVGAKAEAHPQLVAAILAGGHTIGNHSQHHLPFLMLQGQAVLRREIDQAQAVFRTFGIRPLAFRPPVGITSPALWRLLLERGMHCVNFSCRAVDFGNRRCGQLASKLLGKVRGGDILLLHDVAPRPGQAPALLAEFDALLTGLRAKALAVLPLAELTGKEVMEHLDAAPQTRPASRFYDDLAASYDHEQFCTGVSVARLREQALFDR